MAAVTMLPSRSFLIDGEAIVTDRFQGNICRDGPAATEVQRSKIISI